MSLKPSCECGECRKCRRRVYARDYYRRNAEKRREASRGRYRPYDPSKPRNYSTEKERARARLRKAVQDGRVKRQPCEVCGEPKTDAHHDDYRRPFDVRWLCRRHHMELHRVFA